MAIVQTTNWGDAVTIDEVEIHLTPDGLGRAAIVRRSDGHFCIYEHWLPPAEILGTEYFVAGQRNSWFNDQTPLADLYKDKDPISGMYGTLEDARNEILKSEQFEARIAGNALSIDYRWLMGGTNDFLSTSVII